MYNWCKFGARGKNIHFLANFSKQGEEVGSRNAEATFAIGTVIVALRVEFPVLGHLVLAHFYRKCPCLVPHYRIHKQGQSDTDYYKQLGYEYSENGQIESQDIFQKRVSGLVRLYAAIRITDKHRNQAPNLYGLEGARRFVLSVVNLPLSVAIECESLAKQIVRSICGTWYCGICPKSIAEELAKQLNDPASVQQQPQEPVICLKIQF